MNRGVLQSSPVQQMMVGGGNYRNPSCWWNPNSVLLPHHQLMPGATPPPTTTTTNSNSNSWHDYDQQDELLTAESWSQLLLDEEDKSGSDHHQLENNNNNWDQEQQQQEASNNNNNNLVYGNINTNNNWSQMVLLSTATTASPKSSSMMNNNNNMLNFSSNKPDRSSECNSSGGVAKKARVQPSSTQSTTFKVRKEKLGDRITALHQIVSPFGKTDTASVLFEAIGYIRFLQRQIEALSLPYLGNIAEAAGNINDQHSGESELCDEDEIIGEKKDLKSRGLCLVPISCTVMQVESGADYWSQAIGGAAGNFQQNI